MVLGKGLHDAVVLKSQIINFNEGEPFKNCLILEIDASHAMFDTSVKTIKFYNFTINYNVSLDYIWWLGDELEVLSPNSYKLTLNFGNFLDDNSLVICFEHAEVER